VSSAFNLGNRKRKRVQDSVPPAKNPGKKLKEPTGHSQLYLSFEANERIITIQYGPGVVRSVKGTGTCFRMLREQKRHSNPSLKGSVRVERKLQEGNNMSDVLEAQKCMQSWSPAIGQAGGIPIFSKCPQSPPSALLRNQEQTLWHGY
jgi:hypothetical protein